MPISGDDSIEADGDDGIAIGWSRVVCLSPAYNEASIGQFRASTSLATNNDNHAVRVTCALTIIMFQWGPVPTSLGEPLYLHPTTR